MPWCHTCGPLGPANGMNDALNLRETHRREYPHHQTCIMPTLKHTIEKGAKE